MHRYHRSRACFFCFVFVFVCFFFFLGNECSKPLIHASYVNRTRVNMLRMYIVPFWQHLDPFYMEWGTRVYWGRFLLFCVPQSVKTKEINPTRPGSPTPCKQALSGTLEIRE